MPVGEEITPKSLAISPATFRRVAEFITRELGIRMSPAKVPLLQSRLQRRVRLRGCDTLEQYLEAVLDADDADPEVLEFIDAVTTNKTDFFREPGHFDFLTKTALPALDPDPTQPWEARVWSAGCSSGMEAYTLAMVLAEFGAERGQFDYRILGTDISRHMLAAAESAVYDARVIEPVPKALRRKYLLRSRDPASSLIRVVPELRARCQFHRLNLMDAEYGLRDQYDVVFFRNVMIYFDKPTQEHVVNRICARLRPGGYLFIGHSESLHGITAPLQGAGTAIFRRL